MRHAQLNDLIWRAIKKAQVPSYKEPIGLSIGNGKRPDGATLVPWSRGRPMAWDVTVPDTFAASHIDSTSRQAAAAAETAAANKTKKYVSISSTHQFIPLAVEAGGTWCTSALELITDIGKRISNLTKNPLETCHLFQRLSIALQRGNAIAFNSSFQTDY